MIDKFAGEYEFLSNFYPAEVEYHGWKFPTVEHAYQAAKTFSVDERSAIRECATPGRAKRLGRKLTLRPGWEGIRVQTMRGLLEQKFAPGTEMAAKLKATGEHELVEGNTWGDTFWGKCRGEGSNWLGFLLMQVRAGIGG